MAKNLADLLERRRVLEADLVEAVYVRPLGRLHVVRLVGCDLETVATGGGATFAPGSGVTLGSFSGSAQRSLVGKPPPAVSGASRFGVEQVSVNLSTLSIVAAVPDVVPSGAIDFEVHLVGIGFRDDPVDLFTAVDLEGESDPLVTIHDVTFVSDPSSVPGLEAGPGHSVVRVLFDVTAPEKHTINVQVKRA